MYGIHSIHFLNENSSCCRNAKIGVCHSLPAELLRRLNIEPSCHVNCAVHVLIYSEMVRCIDVAWLPHRCHIEMEVCDVGRTWVGDNDVIVVNIDA
jgi:hypothetical protein